VQIVRGGCPELSPPSAVSAPIASAQAPTEKGRLGLTLSQITTAWTGDLDGMVERRMVRVPGFPSVLFNSSSSSRPWS
jgi:hypothetical protein